MMQVSYSFYRHFLSVATNITNSVWGFPPRNSFCFAIVVQLFSLVCESNRRGRIIRNRQTRLERDRRFLFRVLLKESLSCVKSCSELAIVLCWAAAARLSCSLKTNLLMSKRCTSFPSRAKIDIQPNLPRHH